MRKPILVVALWLVSGAVGVGAQDQGTAADLEFARQACLRATAYSIGSADEVPRLFVEF